MESYLKKINHKIAEHCTEDKARKIKKNCLIAGSIILVIGLVGFISCFVSFLVLFLRFETELAMTLWFIAIPFILCVVIGSIVTRIGDAILVEKLKIENQKTDKNSEETKENAVEKDLAKDSAEENNIQDEESVKKDPLSQKDTIVDKETTEKVEKKQKLRNS